MKIKVTKDMCSIEQNEIWNVGDYNVHTVEVDLSDDFNGLVNKVRYFVEDNCYDMLIVNNIAQVPYEATLQEGAIKIGVYGYDADTDVLVQSTSPIEKYISSGSYTGNADNTEPLTPTDKEQMETAIQKNTDDIIDLKANKQDTLISGVNIKTLNNESLLGSGNINETDPVFTESPAYTITNNDITYWNNKANISDIPDVSNFITKDVDNLTYYTKSTDMQNAIDSAVNTEKIARENADVNLQNQIDAITVSSDVIDILGTYQDLQNYDTSHVKANDIIKVLQDSTHSNAMSYYRWVITDHVGAWVYVGSEGPYYTKSESDILLNAKQNEITSNNMLASDLVDDTNQTNQFVTTSEKTTWNNKLDQSDLVDYVKNTDYATNSKGGVIKTGSNANVDNNGVIYADNQTYSDYSSSANTAFISKGTLENVITGKNLETANNKVTSISSSSTDVQYPSAKCVYDNDVIIKDDVNTKYDYLFSLTNLFGKITGTGTNITLNNTSNTIMKLNLDTTTSSQGDDPTPSYPQTVHTITGNNTVLIRSLNLWDTVLEAGGYNLTTGIKVSNNYHRSANYIPITPNSAMEFMKPVGKYTRVLFYDKNKNFLGAPDVIYTNYNYTAFTSPNNAYYMTFLIDSYSSVNNDLMIYYGSTSKPYEAYKQQTYSINLGDIELCKIGDYQDILFKNTMDSEYYDSSLELNKWYLKKNIGKVVFDGNTEFSNSTTNENFSSFFIEKNDMVINKTIMSNYFTQMPIGDATSASKVGIASHNTLARIYVTIPTSDVPISTFMSTHNTIVYYPLATPTYTLLNDTLQTQLDNIQYALAYDTQTNISQTNNDLPFIINAETFSKINTVTSISNLSTDNEIPTAKAVYDYIQSVL